MHELMHYQQGIEIRIKWSSVQGPRHAVSHWRTSTHRLHTKKLPSLKTQKLGGPGKPDLLQKETLKDLLRTQKGP